MQVLLRQLQRGILAYIYKISCDISFTIKQGKCKNVTDILFWSISTFHADHGVGVPSLRDGRETAFSFSEHLASFRYIQETKQTAVRCCFTNYLKRSPSHTVFNHILFFSVQQQNAPINKLFNVHSKRLFIALTQQREHKANSYNTTVYTHNTATVQHQYTHNALTPIIYAACKTAEQLCHCLAFSALVDFYPSFSVTNCRVVLQLIMLRVAKKLE